MSILREVNAAEIVNQPFSGFASNGNTNGAKKPSPKVWMNVQRPKDGRWVSLPLGSGIDTMEPATVKGQNVEWVTLQNDRNEFLADLKAIGESMEPGEERELFTVKVTLRRVKDELVLDELSQSGPQMSQADRLAMLTGASKAPVEPVQPVKQEPSTEDLQAQLKALQAALQTR